MVKLIAGLKGTGKSKEMVKQANEQSLVAKGNIIFIDDDNRDMEALNHRIRFIDVSEMPIEINSGFFGFLCGVIASNYDIEMIYIDGLFNKLKVSEEELVAWFERVEKLSEKFDVNFTITLNTEGDVPSELAKYTK